MRRLYLLLLLSLNLLIAVAWVHSYAYGFAVGRSSVQGSNKWSYEFISVHGCITFGYDKTLDSVSNAVQKNRIVWMDPADFMVPPDGVAESSYVFHWNDLGFRHIHFHITIAKYEFGSFTCPYWAISLLTSCIFFYNEWRAYKRRAKRGFPLSPSTAASQNSGKERSL